MQITRLSGSELTISGHIKKTESYFDLKKAISEMVEEGAKTIKVHIPESITITSSIIGLFLRLVSEDNVAVHLTVGQDQLYTLLDSLNMLKVFNVQKA